MADAAVAPPPLVAGRYDLPAARYHADPCDAPSLSASLITTICHESLAHARQHHPRLTPTAVDEENGAFDLGTAAHALLLEGHECVALIDAPDWRTKAARDQRDAARAAGQTPLLSKVWTDVQAMVAVARGQLGVMRRDTEGEMFRDGEPEQTLIWQEDGVWCRARLDWLRPLVGARAGFAIDDYKTTSASANPDQWSRTIFDRGADVQAVWYARGLHQLTGIHASFRFAVQETYPPYALAVVALAPEAVVLAEKKILYALEHWRAALTTDRWPGYPRRTCYAELPLWHENWWLHKELR